MRRRTFIGAAGVAGAAAIGSPAHSKVLSGAAERALDARFATPPPSADLWVVWHWRNRVATRSGITADLEAMARSGISTVVMFSIGSGAPEDGGPGSDQDSLTPKWWGLVEHAVSECDRLGLTLGMNFCDGWGSAGGPWIPPELSMQRITFTETAVDGGEAFSGMLPRAEWKPGSPRVLLDKVPEGAADFYRDIAVLALPIPDGWDETSVSRKAAVTTTLPVADARKLAAQDNRLPVIETVAAGHIAFAFDRPFTLRSIRMDSGRPLPPGIGNAASASYGFSRKAHGLRVEASDDGRAWRTIGALDPLKGGWQTAISVLDHAVPETSARHFRLVHVPDAEQPNDDNDRLGTHANNHVLRVTNLMLSSTPVVHHLAAKNASTWGLSRRMQAADAPRAASVQPDAIVDLTGRIAADGRLEWTPPPGRWRILRIGHVSTGMGNRPSGAARGLEADKFSAEAAALQYRGWYGAARRHVGGATASRVMKFLFIDSWECGSQNWSTVLPAEFAKRRGYALTRFLPAMCGFPVGDGEVTERFLLDMRTTMAELIHDNFYATVRKLAHADGVTLGSETHSPVLVSDNMLHQDHADVPTGEFWPHQRDIYKPVDIADAASAAAVYNKRVVMTESFTGGHWTEHPGSLKALGDQNFADGVTRFMLHLWQQQYDERLPGPPGAAGTPFNRHNVWWEPGQAWRDYLRRSHALLQAGDAVADIAYFTGEDVPRRAVVRPRFGSVFVTDLEPPESYGFHSVNRDALLRLATMRDGRMTFPGGASYKLLVLPRDAVLTPEVARKIEAMVRDGLSLIGPRPVRSPSLSGGAAADAEVRRIADRLWGDLGARDSRVRMVGRGRVAWGAPIDEVLTASGMMPDLIVERLVDVATGAPPPPPRTPIAYRSATGADRQGGGIAWIHRRLPEGELYYVSNQEPVDVAFDLSLRARGERIDMLDPVAGTVRPLAHWAERDGRALIPMRMPPHGACFLLVRTEAVPADRVTAVQGDDGIAFEQRGGALLAVAARKGRWTVETLRSKPVTLHVDALPEPLVLGGSWELRLPIGGAGVVRTMAGPRPWSALDPAVADFSGTAIYATGFTLRPGDRARDHRLVLELGEVGELAVVTLNGRTFPTAWTAPFSIDITDAVLSGSNRLEIAVTNSWATKLMADAKRPEHERTTFTGGSAGTLPETPPLSGLAGPVAIRVLKELTI